MLNYRLGTVNEKHWGLNQFSAAANLTLSQHFLEKKKKEMSIRSVILKYPEIHFNVNIRVASLTVCA